jgi:hypothetical protein
MNQERKPLDEMLRKELQPTYEPKPIQKYEKPKAPKAYVKKERAVQKPLEKKVSHERITPKDEDVGLLAKILGIGAVAAGAVAGIGYLVYSYWDYIAVAGGGVIGGALAGLTASVISESKNILPPLIGGAVAGGIVGEAGTLWIYGDKMIGQGTEIAGTYIVGGLIAGLIVGVARAGQKKKAA